MINLLKNTGEIDWQTPIYAVTSSCWQILDYWKIELMDYYRVVKRYENVNKWKKIEKQEEIYKAEGNNRYWKDYKD